MPSLSSSTPASQGYLTDLRSLFRSSSWDTRKQLLRSLILRSKRLKLLPSRGRSSSGNGSGRRRRHGQRGEEEEDSPLQAGQLPLRIRPTILVLNVLALLGLAFLGFHPRGGAYIPINDKLLHFICFFLATALFYMIWDVDEEARRGWIWRNAPLLLSGVTCFLAGGIGSEFVQAMLPYKTFQWGDVLANLLGSSLGLFASYHFERRFRTRREIERLYQPLDVEMYGDGFSEESQSDEDEGMLDPVGSSRGRDSSQRQGSNGEGRRGALKKSSNEPVSSERRVRFGEDQAHNFWSDDPTSVSGASSSKRAASTADLFSIEDEDEVEDAVRDTSSAPHGDSQSKHSADVDAWRDT
ncbi:hypothetical protein IE81DRAFT_366856 [Ceraceosorus guamensis]|uniref:VanZ-like domain-containing protein n=1 Tax=Ceraceosorus guamensis TaxID=1522189 RepID=A0A316W0Q0_9BASI|nr:hypothetical protein IE81DRAFT_366856 [Ceraceosorus guamensis]PWN42121.1 hypothetical protein IE81DRAFT_366856 [Ceraceosorus guamensis]